MSLFEELEQLSQRIKTQLRQMRRNETVTVDAAVRPFIHALGYDTFNTNEVFPQYSILRSDAVDVAILRDGQPIIFVEAKNASVDLGAKQWKQLFEYFNASKGKVHVGILTNGLEFQFYTDSVQTNIMDDEPFLTIDMLDLDERSVSVLNTFTKSHFDTERVVGFAQRQQIQKLLRQEMEDPSVAIVNHFSRDLHDGHMSANDKQRYANLLRQAWRDLVETEIAGDLQRYNDKGKGVITPDDTKDSKPLPGDITNGTAIVPIYLKYKGQILAEATLHFPSDRKLTSRKVVWFEGKMRSVGGSAKDIVHQTADRKVAVLGFGVWKLDDPLNGNERSLYHLREDSELQKRVFQKYVR